MPEIESGDWQAADEPAEQASGGISTDDIHVRLEENGVFADRELLFWLYCLFLIGIIVSHDLGDFDISVCHFQSVSIIACGKDLIIRKTGVGKESLSYVAVKICTGVGQKRIFGLAQLEHYVGLIEAVVSHLNYVTLYKLT